jgi:hypothetical protein
MSTPAEYRKYAEESLQAMRAAMVPEVRTALLLMARRWTELAERAERTSNSRARYPINPQPALYGNDHITH